MKLSVLVISMVLFGLNAQAKDQKLGCEARSEANLISPVQDNGIYLLLQATLDSNFNLNNLSIVDFPYTNDSETILTQKFVVGRVVTGVAHTFALDDGSMLLFPEGFSQMKKFPITLQGIKGFNERQAMLQCEITR